MLVILVILGLLVLFIVAVALRAIGTSERSTTIRRPAVAGLFYPSFPPELERKVDTFLRDAGKVEVRGRVVGLIAPHAGYDYSGPLAGYAYKALEGKKFDTVVLIGPSHRVYFDGHALYAKGYFETPFGQVKINDSLTDQLMKESKRIIHFPQAHLQEHSLEVQLPFLQRILKEFQIVPILMADQSEENCKVLSDVLIRVLQGKNALLIASTDLSHYYPYERARAMDSVALKAIEKFDSKELSGKIKTHECELCGAGPVITVMLAAKGLGANKVKILKYANSGDVTGDKSRVVGYSAVAFYEGREGGNLPMVGELSERAKLELLTIARRTIEGYLKNGSIPQLAEIEEELKEKRGVFVTLTKKHNLRGCIGYIVPIKPLYEAVPEMAIAAATRDPRFPPLTLGELKDIKIEISVLSPLERVDDVQKIEVGTHGVFIKKGAYSGLLLPQVATEYGWDREEFLRHTCRKAGLPDNAWKEEAEIYTFTAQIFSEEGA